jgi:hypothetical protein
VRKRAILLEKSINREVLRITEMLYFSRAVIFYNTAWYSNLRMPVPYGVRFGHLDTLRFIHAPYEIIFEYTIDFEWLNEFEEAAFTSDYFCGIPFQ